MAIIQESRVARVIKVACLASIAAWLCLMGLWGVIHMLLYLLSGWGVVRAFSASAEGWVVGMTSVAVAAVGIWCVTYVIQEVTIRQQLRSTTTDEEATDHAA